MANTAATVMTLVTVLTTGVAAATKADPRPETTVVLHVTDRATTATHGLGEAEGQVTQVYRAIGVHVLWTQGAAALAPPDGVIHLDVILLAREAVDVKCRADRLADTVMGSAAGPTKRAYIFVNRIVDHARLTTSSVGTLLAMVIAHEVGHLLLPAFSHAPSGIMRANWDGPVRRVPGFTDDQGATIRMRVAAARAN